MILILFLSLMFNTYKCVNKPKNDVIQIIFKNNEIKFLETTEICANVFEFFIDKEKRWNNNVEFDFKEFDIKIFELIEDLFTSNKLITLNINSFYKLVILIDFLGLENKNYQDKINKFWTNLVNSVFDLIINQNCKLNEKYITCFKCRNIFMLELFYRCLRSLNPIASFEYKNNDLRIFLDEQDSNVVSYNIVIKNENDDTILYTDTELKKLIFWFVKSLGLTKTLIFENYFEITIIFFDKIYNDNLQFSNTIFILENEFKPYYLKLDNVLEDGFDLNILQNLPTVGNLEISSHKLIEVKISEFEMNSLTILKISNVKITLQDFQSTVIKSNLSSLILISCQIIDSKIILSKYRDSNLEYLRIENCLLSNSFFEYYKSLQNLERIDFLNNKLSNKIKIKNSEDLLFDKFVDYQICCFSKSQIKSLIIQRNINHIEFECCTQIINFEIKHDFLNSLSRHNDLRNTGLAKSFRNISIIERIY